MIVTLSVITIGAALATAVAMMRSRSNSHQSSWLRHEVQKWVSDGPYGSRININAEWTGGPIITVWFSTDSGVVTDRRVIHESEFMRMALSRGWRRVK